MKNEIVNNKNSLFLIFNWKLKKMYEKMFYQLTEELQLTQNEIDVLIKLMIVAVMTGNIITNLLICRRRRKAETKR